LATRHIFEFSKKFYCGALEFISLDA